MQQKVERKLLTKRTISKKVKKLKKNIAMPWIDYKRDCDMVPLFWIKVILNVTGVAANI